MEEGNDAKRSNGGKGVAFIFKSFMRSPLIHLTLFHSLGVLLLCNNVLVSVFLLLMTLIEKNREPLLLARIPRLLLSEFLTCRVAH